MECENDYNILLKPLYIRLQAISCKEIKPGDLSKIQNINSFKNSSLILKEKTEVSKKNINNIKQYMCSHIGCDRLFGKESRLIVHERTHTGERPFKCHYDGCERSYTRKFHLTRHINVLHASFQPNSKESYSCDKCHKSFINIYAKKKHETHVHKGDRYTCRECGQTFRKQQHLKTHSFVHTGIKPYKCNFPGCGNVYTVPSLLKRHAFSHLKGRYVCCYDECSRKLDTYTELRHHMTNSHPKVCEFCHQEFKHVCRLKSHLLTHEDVREAVFCPFTPCERYYFDEKNLHNHICKKHNENFKGFECPLCKKWLATKQTLKRHLTTHSDSSKPKGRARASKPRKPRKDKGVPRTNYAKLLSGYSSDGGTDVQESGIAQDRTK